MPAASQQRPWHHRRLAARAAAVTTLRTRKLKIPISYNDFPDVAKLDKIIEDVESNVIGMDNNKLHYEINKDVYKIKNYIQKNIDRNFLLRYYYRSQVDELLSRFCRTVRRESSQT